MKKVVIILSCLLLLASVGAAGLSCGDNGDGPKVTSWRLATYSMPGTLQTNMLQEFADRVEDKSNGTLKIKIFPGGTLYQLAEIFDATSSGAVDLGFAGVTSYIGKAPATASALVYVNVVAKDLNHDIAMANALVKQDSAIIKEASDAGITHLFYAPTGSSDSYFKFPVNSPSDIKGKKLGCTQGVAPIVQILGATPVPMDVADLYLSAQTGLIDGWLMAPLENFLSMKISEVLPYLVNFQLNSIMSVLMNTSSFNSLTTDQQEALNAAATETQADWISATLASDNKILQQAQGMSGVHVTVLSGDTRAAWYNAAIIPVFGGMMTKYMTPDQKTEAMSIIASVQQSVS